MPKRSRKYLEAAKQVDRTQFYAPREGLELAARTSPAGFEATVEVHMRMGVDSRHADQQVRGVVSLPHGTGKRVRILVFAEVEAENTAQEAGADYVGGDEVIKKIQDGWLEFDLAIAIPQIMGKVGKLGKILGPRGLMPSPKAGTIVPPEDLPRLIKESRLGRIEFRLDKTANLHVPIGRVSFSVDSLMENLAALMEAVQRAKPSGARGQYIRKIVVSTTMGPGIKLDVPQTLALTSA